MRTLTIFSLPLMAILSLNPTFLRADNLTFENPNGTVWSNFYTSPYYALDSSTQPGKTLTILCLDYNHEIAPPYSWVADLNSLSPSNISDYQYGGSYPGAASTPFAFQGDSPSMADPHDVKMQAGSDAYHRYLEAAWLFTNLLDAQSKSDTSSMNVSQVAAWDLFVDINHISDLQSRIKATTGSWNFKNYVGSASWSNLNFRDAVDEAVKEAQTAVLGGWNPSTGWNVVTGNISWVQNSNNGVLVQEFMSPYSATPEPSTLLLLASCLLISFLLIRNRSAKSSRPQ